VVVKGTRGNEGAERSGVHDEEEWTKNRALRDSAGRCVPGRQASYTFDTEGTMLESEGRIGRAECHLHRGGGYGNKRK